MKRFFLSSARLEHPAAHLGLAVLRVTAGVSLAVAHGFDKVPPPPGLVAAVRGMGFPAPEAFAWCAALAEAVGGLLLAVGFLTRPAAFAVAFTMGVALFGMHWGDPWAKQELAALYGAAALCLLFAGPGRLSVDALLRDDR